MPVQRRVQFHLDPFLSLATKDESAQKQEAVGKRGPRNIEYCGKNIFINKNQEPYLFV